MSVTDPRGIRIEDYTYELPDDRIARYPLAERDSSKLLVYKEGNITDGVYRNIATHIPGDSLMVFNQTKVIHARLLFKKATGGIIEIFCLAPYNYPDVQTAMMQTRSVQWECMIGGASKWKPGTQLQITHSDFILSAAIVEKLESSYVVELSWENEDYTFADILTDIGVVPLPPYLHRESEKSDEQTYQTIYAKHSGSVAAPTAGLHFTQNIMAALATKNIATDFVTLHVGAGTFKPVKSETMEGHDMHAEWIEVEKTSIEKILGNLSNGIIAVGTTSLRTLESLYWMGAKLALGHAIDFSAIAVSQWDPYELPGDISTEVALKALLHHYETNNITKLITRTQIIIAPGYKMRIIRGLVTNFHQPRSTLLLIIAAILGDDWHKVYDYALSYRYRFLSYGDGCLLWL